MTPIFFFSTVEDSVVEGTTVFTISIKIYFLLLELIMIVPPVCSVKFFIKLMRKLIPYIKKCHERKGVFSFLKKELWIYCLRVLYVSTKNNTEGTFCKDPFVLGVGE